MDRADQSACRATIALNEVLSQWLSAQRGLRFRLRVASSLRYAIQLGLSLTLGSSLLVACGSGRRSQEEPHEEDASTGSSSSSSSSSEKPGGGSTKTQEEPDHNPAPPVVIRRLNKDQYDASIRDLFGRDFGLAKDFPGEDPSLGFDNIADAMSLSPLQVELYERAAQSVVAYYTDPTPADRLDQRFEAESMSSTTGQACCGGFWNLFANGSIEQSFEVKKNGTYELSVRAYGHQMGNESAKLRLRVGEHLEEVRDIAATQDAPQVTVFEVELPVGAHKIEASFINDSYDPIGKKDRNLLIDWIKVQGPQGAKPAQNPNLAAMLACGSLTGVACYRRWVEDFGLRVWRRPLDEAELAVFHKFYDSSSTSELELGRAVAKALGLFLLSPNFLFRVEVDPEPEAHSSRELNGYELATRLSYFLWSSTPDQRLLDLAKDDQLLADEVLEKEVQRMIQDPKAQALVHNFAGQWLSIRGLGDVFKDVQTYPAFTPSLVLSMKKERELFFESFISRERALSELLLSDKTFVNRELAQFYGLETDGLSDDSFVERSLAQTERRGILGQAGLMAALGHPETTAPVLRGKWILEHLLCIEPPPPPSDIDIPPVKPSKNETMREQLAQHRADPNCKGCHDLMDPIGLALENYDGIGQWRSSEGGQEIDVSGSLPSGAKLRGAKELAIEIAKDSDFIDCVVRKTVIYALGKDVHKHDESELELLVSNVRDSNASFRALLSEIVMSPLFRRRG